MWRTRLIRIVGRKGNAPDKFVITNAPLPALELMAKVNLVVDDGSIVLSGLESVFESELANNCFCCFVGEVVLLKLADLGFEV
jgi:hypothetical protein